VSKTSYSSNAFALQLSRFSLGNQRAIFIGLILLIALLAFELFNFDTTQFALSDLLGEVRFLGIKWATILAIAFCAIDFAGLFRLFTPDRGRDANREMWYLMGAWLLGATMNAVMTWWAVSVTLLDNNFGNEVLSREQLLHYVPIFVAVLVWLTRILFIGAFSVAGEQLLDKRPAAHGGKAKPFNQPNATAANASRSAAPPSRLKTMPSAGKASSANTPRPSAPVATPPASPPPPAPAVPSYQNSIQNGTQNPRTSRVRQRPPVPNSSVRRPSSGLQARSRT